MDTVDVADCRWLLTSEAEGYLARAAEGGESPLRLARQLRKQLSPQRARLVMELAQLRRRAESKFAAAHRMAFTRKLLEQSTDEQIARYKATRFPEGAAIADLCCGIGGDLLALAARGHATGVDRDRIACCFAEANCRVCGVPVEGVQTADVTTLPLDAFEAWHIDPDRRVSGRRSTRVERHEPDAAAIERLRAVNEHAAVKLAPAAPLPDPWSGRGEREWIGSRGQCRQQVVWLGHLARHAGLHVATVIAPDNLAHTVIGNPAAEIPLAASIASYVFEPHHAVLAAGLIGTLAQRYRLAALATDVAYLTGDRPIQDHLLAAFQVRDVLPLDRKQLRAYLRLRGVGRLEVKKRGLTDDVERLRREVVARGSQAATLLLARHQRRAVAIVAQRVSAQSS